MVHKSRTNKPAQVYDAPYQPHKRNALDCKLVDDDGTVLRQADTFNTPTHKISSWDQCRRLGRRSLGLVSNSIFYDHHTSCPNAPSRSQCSWHYIINPAFVEHLMGYPAGWTDALH